MEDRDIVALFLARDEAAIGECEKKYGSLCLHVALRILGSPQDAEECVSDTWLRIWDAIPPTDPRRLDAYLLKITRNLALDRLHAKQAEKRAGDETLKCLDELADVLPDGESPLDGVLLRDLLNRFLRGLKEDERKIFVLRYTRILTVEEIASRTGKSKSAVKASLYRTRKKLRDYLKKEGIDV